MKLMNIAATNFRGWTGAQPLTGFDIFVGPNKSGKTKRENAIQFGVFGKIPGYPAKTGELYRVLSDKDNPDNEKVGVILDFQDSPVVQIKRSIIRKEKAGGEEIYMRLEVAYPPGSDYAKAAQGAPLRKQEAILEAALNPVIEAFDLSQFLTEHSGPEREKEIIALFGRSHVKVQSFKKTYFDPVNGGTNDYRGTLKLKLLEDWTEKTSWSEALVRVEALTREERNRLNGEKRRLEAAKQKLAALREGAEIRNLPELENELKTLRDKAEETGKSIGEEDSRRRTYKVWQDSITSTKERLEGLKAKLFGAKANLEQLTEDKLKEAQAKLEGFKADSEAAEEGFKEAESNLNQLKAEKQMRVVEKAAQVKGLQPLQATMKLLEAGKPLICEYTNQACSDITKEMVTRLVKEKESKLEVVQKELQGLNLQGNELTQVLMAAELTKHNIADAKVQLAGDIRQMTESKVHLDEDVKSLTEDIDSAESRQGALKAEKPPMTSVDIDGLRDLLKGTKSKISDLDVLKDNSIKADERNRQADELEAQHEETVENLEVVLALLLATSQAMVDYKSEIDQQISEALSGLHSIEGIEFKEGDFWVKGMHFATLSGAEKALCMLSARLAFMVAKEAGLRILSIDDAQILDTAHWKVLYGAVREALASGVICNFIAAGVDLESLDEGGKVWTLGQG